MRILDKYILKKILVSYLFIILVFIGLYLFIDISSNIGDILKTSPPKGLLISYYFNTLPLIFSKVSPLALLIATLYVFGELNKNNEILSIRTAGVSILRIALPVLFFALLIAIGSLIAQEKLLPQSQRKIEEAQIKFITKDYSKSPEETNIAFNSKDMIFFVKKFTPKDATLHNVVIFKENRDKIIEKKIICRKIIYKDGKWEGKNVIEYNLNDKGKIIGSSRIWETKTIDLDEKPQALTLKKSIFAQSSSLEILRKEIARLRKIKAYGLLSSLTIDYHRRASDPFSHIFLVIGILPLALQIKKRQIALSSLGVGIVFGLIYYSFGVFCIALGKSGFLLPVLSVWITPIFFITVGVVGILLIK